MAAVGDVYTQISASAHNFQPAAGETWKVYAVAGSTWDGSFGRFEVPNHDLALYDGTNPSYVRYRLAEYQMLCPLELYITNTIYVRCVPVSGNQGFSAICVATASGSKEGKCAVSSVAAGAYLTIQPGASEEWMLTQVGSALWSSGYPDVELYAYNGTTEVKARSFLSADSAMHDFGKPIRMHMTNSIYARLKNTNASARYLCYSGFRTK